MFAPYWKEDPKDVEVVKGKDAHLACLSEGYPVPKVTWRKTSQGNLYSQNLFHDTNRKTQRQEYFSNGTLLIREITEADEGTYLCEVSNQVGKGLSAIITLKVHAPPHVQSKEKIEARRGESVDLQCYASGDPPFILKPSPRWTPR
ncbi:Down syndrome cell adhesion molecule-like protein Dscam2 [Armadillidium vulgare]|nr:Down syndrome cell adhesion molecule-like protein Dscam2 [Armadillidium vulgare]